MDFNSDQIAAIIGSQQLEIIALRIQLGQSLEAQKKAELELHADAKPLEVVK